MTPDEMRKVRKAASFTQDQLGKALGYSRKSVISWENSVHRIPEQVAVKVLEICAGVPIIARTPPKLTRLTLDTIKYYGEMRRDGTSHASIMKLWNEKNFVPTAEAQAGIAADWPDILNGGESK